MTINYRLSFNHTLRWIDCRHTCGEVISGKTVLAYLMIDKVGDPPVVVVSNYRPMRELKLMAPCKTIYTCVIGAGLIEHSLFTTCRYDAPVNNFTSQLPRERLLYFGFSEDDGLIIIADESVIEGFYPHKPKAHYRWGALLNIEIQSRPIALAIPVQKISTQ